MQIAKAKLAEALMNGEDFLQTSRGIKRKDGIVEMLGEMTQLTQEESDFVSYLEESLIPKLRELDMPATAFEKAVAIIKRLTT